jgi:hypothetical protein
MDKRPIVELTDAELDHVVGGGGNPHGLNPGGQPCDCASASDLTGDPHTKHNPTGDPHPKHG